MLNKKSFFYHLAGVATAAVAFTSTSQAVEVNESFLVMFKPLPAEVPSPDNELSEARINLGRQLYY